MKKHTKRLFAAMLAGAMAFSLTACGGDAGKPADAGSTADTGSTGNADKAAEPAKTESKKKLGVILKANNSEYWKCMIAGIEAAEADLNVDVDINGPTSETAYDEQINMIETMLNMPLDGLIIAPLQPDSAAQLVANAPMPIYAVDTTFPAENLTSYIGVSNEEAAYEGGKYMAEKLGAGTNIVIIGGVQGDTTAEDRIKGFTKGIEENGANVLEMQYTDATADRAVAVIEGMLSNYGDKINGVVCHSDDVAMGAVTALQNAGLKDKVVVCGFGGISGAKVLDSGVLDASININPYQMGYNAVDAALKVANGGSVDSFIATEPEILDSINIKEFMVKLDGWMK